MKAHRRLILIKEWKVREKNANLQDVLPRKVLLSWKVFPRDILIRFSFSQVSTNFLS